MRCTQFVTMLAVLWMCATTAPLHAQQDQNLHQLLGTMTSCGCQAFARMPPSTPCGAPGNPFAPCVDTICFASFEIAAPAPHWDEETPAAINVEINGQAIGQCAHLRDVLGLPRRVQMLFWVEAGGPDFVHEILARSQVRGYYLVDHGPSD